MCVHTVIVFEETGVFLRPASWQSGPPDVLVLSWPLISSLNKVCCHDACSPCIISPLLCLCVYLLQLNTRQILLSKNSFYALNGTDSK